MQTTTLKKTLLHNKNIEHLCIDWVGQCLKMKIYFELFLSNILLRRYSFKQHSYTIKRWT